MNESLTMEKYFSLLDECKNSMEFKKTIDAYIPQKLYKYCSIPDDEGKANERFEQLSQEKGWFSKRKVLNDPFEFEHLSLRAATQEAQCYYNNKALEWELFCMTSSPLNKLMWSHYTNAYKGYCIEFCVEYPRKIYPVIYENKIPDLSNEYQGFYDNRLKYKNDTTDFSDEYQKLMIKSALSELLNFDKMKDIFALQYTFISKDTCWAYESEFRIIENNDESEKDGSIQYLPQYGLHVSKIIIGANCSPCHVEKLRETSRRIVLNREENAATSKVPYTPVETTKISWDEKLQLIEVALDN